MGTTGDLGPAGPWQQRAYAGPTFSAMGKYLDWVIFFFCHACSGSHFLFVKSNEEAKKKKIVLIVYVREMRF